MLWLGIDFETTGLDPQKDRVTEVGAALWDMDRKTPVQIYNSLVYDTDYPPISREAEKVSGISYDLIKRYGITEEGFCADLFELFDNCDYVIAHNAKFDKAFLEATLLRIDRGLPKKHWLCSRKDVQYPEDYSQKLQYLASHHGFVNPFSHRAVFDVLTMFKVLEDYSPDQIVRWSKEPDITVRAMVSFAEKDLAKQRGYHWNGERKWWLKELKKFQFEDEQTQARETGFEVKEVTP